MGVRKPSRVARADERIRSANEMRQILLRERARADRNSHLFSVLVFDFESPRSEADPQDLVRHLAERVRMSDEIGWLEDRRLAVLLPETTRSGACVVAEDIGQAAPEAPRPDVIQYPADRDSDRGNGTGGGSRRHKLPEPSSEHDQAVEEIIEELNGGVPEGLQSGPTTPRGDKPDPWVGQGVDALLLYPLPLWKRLLDVAVSGAALLVLSPLLIVTWVAIKLSALREPALFRQTRCGQGGRPFTIFKFRTMIRDAEDMKKGLLDRNEQTGPVFKIHNDPRITRLGKFLRRTSIDELPQLWNVFIGDMTLVGPRPPIPSEVARYDTWQRRRLDVPVGLTCTWQVSGRSKIKFQEWVRMDIRYAEERNFLLDLKLLLLTVPAVLTGRGAN